MTTCTTSDPFRPRPATLGRGALFTLYAWLAKTHPQGSCCRDLASGFVPEVPALDAGHEAYHRFVGTLREVALHPLHHPALYARLRVGADPKRWEEFVAWLEREGSVSAGSASRRDGRREGFAIAWAVVRGLLEQAQGEVMRRPAERLRSEWLAALGEFDEMVWSARAGLKRACDGRIDADDDAAYEQESLGCRTAAGVLRELPLSRDATPEDARAAALEALHRAASVFVERRSLARPFEWARAVVEGDASRYWGGYHPRRVRR